jgi:hypothetical protein
MSFEKCIKDPSPISDKNTIYNYKTEYEKNGLDEVQHKNFSNSDINIYSKALYSVGAIPIRGLISFYNDEQLFNTFRDMATKIYARLNRDMKTNINAMIDKFQRNEGGVYENEILTNHIKKHASTKRYCSELEKHIKTMLKKNRGKDNIWKGLENNEVDFALANEETRDVKIRRAGKGKDFSLTPVFDAVGLSFDKFFNTEKWDNMLGGATIALNDIWATEVVITKYEQHRNLYKGEYQVTLWDHFGLDLDDIGEDKPARHLEGFHAWFILQHFRGYRPFITKITFERTFEGDLNDEIN